VGKTEEPPRSECNMCDGTGYKDYAGFAIDPCDHVPPSPWPWADRRLGQAYDLIEAVRLETLVEHDSHRMLTRIMGEIEDADIELGATT
jgi:hypothetical protein